MIALPVLAAVALLAEGTGMGGADAPSPQPASQGEPAAAPSNGVARPLSLAVGPAFSRLDDIPLTQGVARIGLTAARRGVGIRPAFGFFLEAAGGRTEGGLGVGGLRFGPHLVLVGDRVRGGLGVELGTLGVVRATNDSMGFIAVCVLQASLELDVWRFGRSALFVAAAGTLGPTGEGTLRGLSALVGIRP